MAANKFVFVVCGAEEHIDTLHFSLGAMCHFSKNEVIVVTDSRRNEKPIEFGNIIDVETPAELDHHQASIYLKTGLHKFLPSGHLYCYVDTDIVALSSVVDRIFEMHIPPVTFAPDHCVMDKFSPAAVHCGCIKEREDERKEIALLLKKYECKLETTPAPIINEQEKQFIEHILHKKETLINKLMALKRDQWKYALITLKFNLSWRKFKLDEDTFFDKREKYWVDADGNIILKDSRYHKEFEYFSHDQLKLIEENTAWRWSREQDAWISPSGRNIDEALTCGHLKELIAISFGIEIIDSKWQHWNGGVFLFDDQSYSFLEAWHTKTMKIFKDPNWKTRDQGTLTATCWEFGLEGKGLLPPEFNFIADWYRDGMEYKGHLKFYLASTGREVVPALIHIYHHWGDENWSVWNDVANHIKKARWQNRINNII